MQVEDTEKLREVYNQEKLSDYVDYDTFLIFSKEWANYNKRYVELMTSGVIDKKKFLDSDELQELAYLNQLRYIFLSSNRSKIAIKIRERLKSKGLWIKDELDIEAN